MRSKLHLSAALLGGLLCVATSAGAQQAPNPLDAIPEKMPFDIPYGAPISLDRAEAAIAAAVAEAKRHDWKFNVAVVDTGGNLVAFQRSSDRSRSRSTRRTPRRSFAAKPRSSRAASSRASTT